MPYVIRKIIKKIQSYVEGLTNSIIDAIVADIPPIIPVIKIIVFFIFILLVISSLNNLLYKIIGITNYNDVPAMPPMIFNTIANLGIAKAIKLIIKIIINRTY